MRARAGEAVPVALLLLLPAMLLSGCNAGRAAPAAAAAPQVLRMVTVAPTLAQGIPVTGAFLELASCDPKGSFLNLRLSDPLTGNGAGQLQVELNGRPAQCHHPLGDTSILSCTIPPLTLFPVLVAVRLDDALVAQFDYDSALCPAPGQEQSGQNGYVPSIPTATGTATEQPGTPAAGKPAASSSGLHATPTLLPTWTGQPLPSEPPSTEPGPTEPPPTEPPPPTQPPSTEPPPTQKSEPTPKPTPTHKPAPTPKPTHTDKPPVTEPPPTPSG